MKYNRLMTEEEKAEEVRKRIKRATTSMYNACVKSSKENNCKGCPFDVAHGCNLYDHPIEWKSRIESLK